jgi:site-specific recombinase XerD
LVGAAAPVESRALAARVAVLLADQALPDHIITGLAEYLVAARGTMPPNTERAWLADLRVFTAWCESAGEPPLPASPAAVARFVDWAGIDRRPTTVQRQVASISKLHQAAALESPTDDRLVRLRLRALRLAKPRRPRQAAPLREVHVQQMVEQLGDRLIDLRDRALLLVARDTGLRGASLVSLEIADLAVDTEGVMTCLVQREKTDQYGQGRMVAFSADARGAVEAWLSAAALDGGPIFRSVSREGRVGATSLKPRAVLRRLRLRALDIGLLDRISAHSTRVGGAQDLLEQGYELPQIMQAFGWKDPRMAMRYAERILAARSVSVRRFDRPRDRK